MATQKVEGFLQKMGEKGIVKSWKTRWFTLDQNILAYYKERSDPVPISFILLQTVKKARNATTQSPNHHGFEFVVETDTREFLLSASSDEDRVRWVSSVNIAKAESSKPIKVGMRGRPHADSQAPPLPTALSQPAPTVTTTTVPNTVVAVTPTESSGTTTRARKISIGGSRRGNESSAEESDGEDQEIKEIRAREERFEQEEKKQAEVQRLAAEAVERKRIEEEIKMKKEADRKALEERAKQEDARRQEFVKKQEANDPRVFRKKRNEQEFFKKMQEEELRKKQELDEQKRKLRESEEVFGRPIALSDSAEDLNHAKSRQSMITSKGSPNQRPAVPTSHSMLVIPKVSPTSSPKVGPKSSGLGKSSLGGSTTTLSASNPTSSTVVSEPETISPRENVEVDDNPSQIISSGPDEETAAVDDTNENSVIVEDSTEASSSVAGPTATATITTTNNATEESTNPFDTPDEPQPSQITEVDHSIVNETEQETQKEENFIEEDNVDSQDREVEENDEIEETEEEDIPQQQQQLSTSPKTTSSPRIITPPPTQPTTTSTPPLRNTPPQQSIPIGLARPTSLENIDLHDDESPPIKTMEFDENQNDDVDDETGYVRKKIVFRKSRTPAQEPVSNATPGYGYGYTTGYVNTKDSILYGTQSKSGFGSLHNSISHSIGNASNYYQAHTALGYDKVSGISSPRENAAPNPAPVLKLSGQGQFGPSVDPSGYLQVMSSTDLRRVIGRSLATSQGEGSPFPFPGIQVGAFCIDYVADKKLWVLNPRGSMEIGPRSPEREQLLESLREQKTKAIAEEDFILAQYLREKEQAVLSSNDERFVLQGGIVLGLRNQKWELLEAPVHQRLTPLNPNPNPSPNPNGSESMFASIIGNNITTTLLPQVVSFIDTVAQSVTEEPQMPDEEEIVDLLMQLEDAITTLRLYSSECVSEVERKDKFDDKKNKKIASLVRGKLCTALAAVIGHNLKATILLRKIYVWNFIEACCSEATYTNMEALSMMNAVRTINTFPTTDPNMKFRSFVCDALNNKTLVPWMQFLMHSFENIDKYYEDVSIIRIPEIFQKFITCVSFLPQDIPFTLSLDYELQKQPSQIQQQPTTPTAKLTSLFSSFF